VAGLDAADQERVTLTPFDRDLRALLAAVASLTDSADEASVE
jgi:hypothetical protein